jgi:hypothetical protein
MIQATIAAKRVEELKTLGFNIQHIHRSNREGYKAGALQNGLSVHQESI